MPTRKAMPDTDALPINTVLPELRSALERPGAVVLAAPPGSGKTTLVPLRLLGEPWLTGRILMLEPRRLAARAAAARMAELLGEAPGGRVGYRVRFDSRVSAATRIEVVTEGILTRRLQRDPALEGVSLVIFDEFHERSLQADLGLALCWDVAHALREGLRLLVMSATLDTEAVAGLLKAPVVVGGGRSWPVTAHYRERPLSAPIARATVEAILGALGRERGDLLASLPGAGEIRQAERLLSQRLGPEVEICPLYGDLGKQQDHAIRPSAHGRRRVVLATAIAETSLTIEGVTTVVDSGWARLPAFDPNSGLTRLQTQRVSRASAEQRAGRAGRLGPGVCYRLWSAAEHSALPPHTPAEILGADLAPLALELANWGVGDPAQLAWLDPPPKGAYAQAVELLRGLDALDRKGRITPAGQRMAGLGLHPRLAHMLGYAAASGQRSLGADLAALLSERDLLRRRTADLPAPVDIEERLHLLRRWRRSPNQIKALEEVDAGACARVERAARQWKDAIAGEGGGAPPLSVGGLLSLAYPDRIARRRPSGGYRLSGGRGASLPDTDRLNGEAFLLIAALDAGRGDVRVFLAAPLALDETR
ncbi:MAG: ATP-dependent helicase HrpB [Candidatus Sedimenticola endophacoides]